MENDFVKHLYIVRHGQTDYNKKKIVQGRGINAPLNTKGQTQAFAFYERYKEEKFDALYASNLLRAQQSVAHFTKHHEMIIKPELDEISWGEHEGKYPTTQMKKEFKAMLESWYEGNTHLKIPGGESPEDVWNRITVFFEELAQTPHKKVLICSHGRTIRLILCYLLGTPMKNMKQYSSNNLGLHQVHWEPPHASKLLVLNDNKH